MANKVYSPQEGDPLLLITDGLIDVCYTVLICYKGSRPTCVIRYGDKLKLIDLETGVILRHNIRSMNAYKDSHPRTETLLKDVDFSDKLPINSPSFIFIYLEIYDKLMIEFKHPMKHHNAAQKIAAIKAFESFLKVPLLDNIKCIKTSE